jgi:kynureninase
LREKSLSLTGFLQRLIAESLPHAVQIITPDAPEERGCQLSLRVALSTAAAKRCRERLAHAGVIGDWREPDVLRLAPVPLYNSFGDVLAAADALALALRA